MMVEFNMRDGKLIIISSFSTNSNWFIKSIPSGVSSNWYIDKLKKFLTNRFDSV